MNSLIVLLNIGWMLLMVKGDNELFTDPNRKFDSNKLKTNLKEKELTYNPRRPNGPPPYDWDKVVTDFNNFRKSVNRDLPDMKRDERLMEIAQQYAEDCVIMIGKNQQDLIYNGLNPSHETLVERVFGKGDISPSKGYAAQNLIMTVSPLVSDMEHAIVNSKIHRENILGGYSLIGLGHSHLPCDSIIHQDNTTQAHLICSHADADSKLNIYVQVLSAACGGGPEKTIVEKTTTTLLKPIIIIQNSKTTEPEPCNEPPEHDCITKTISKRYKLYQGLQPDEPITDKESALRLIGQLTDKNPDATSNSSIVPEKRYEYCQPILT